jgi:cytochrome oxidase Cu insertion factor (SCO1/SenC/PrrC family)
MSLHATNGHKYFTIGLLLLLFFGPMLGAWSLYSERLFSTNTINYGQLIIPPLIFQQLPLATPHGESLITPLAGKWLLIYFNPTKCDNVCEKKLYEMRQIRTALGKDMDRVIRVFLTYPSEQTGVRALGNEYLGTIYLTTTKKELAVFLNSYQGKTQVLNQGAFFLVDPLGNVMMHYASTQPPKGIYSDLKRLLMTSQIG